MNMQLRQCFARAKHIRLKISQKRPDFSGFFISKKAKGIKKRPNFKIWLQKSQIGNPTTQELRMRISTQENIKFFVMYRSPENLVFLSPC